MSNKYTDDLIERLKDPQYAAMYLDAALCDQKDEDFEQRFLLALRDVAQAHGISNLARSTELSRQNLYKIFSEKGNPELKTLTTLLNKLGLRLSISPESEEAS